MGMGMFEVFFVVIFVFGGALGLPIGMPPGPEDPLMSKVAPDECMFYASWTGIGKLDAQAGPTDAWLAQPKMQAMLNKLRQAYRGQIETKIAESDDPVASALTGLALELAECATTNPAAIYVSDFKIVDDRPEITGAIVIGLDEQTDAVETSLQNLDDTVSELSAEQSGIEQIEIDGQPVLKMLLPDSKTEMYLALRGKYFIVGFGKQSLTDVATNSKTDPPKWLIDARQELPVKRFASMSYLNVKLAAQMIPNDDHPEVRMFRELSNELFLSDVKSVAWVSGLDDQGFIGRASMRTTEDLTGILAAIDRQPIPRQWLDDIPEDALVALASRLSPQEILKIMKKTARRSNTEEELEESLEQFQKVTGLSLEEEFLAAIGDFLYFYYQYDAARPFEGWLGSVRIDDDMSFPLILESLNDGIEEMTEEQGLGEVEKKTIDDHEFFSMTQSRWASFTWGLVDQQWFFAYRPEAIGRHLDEREAGVRFSQSQEVAAIYEFGESQGFGGPIAVAQLNLKKLLEIIWPFLGMVAQPDQKPDPDFDFTFGDIPELDVWTNRMRPNVNAVFRTPNGFQLLQRQTYPGNTPSVTMSAFAMLASPYVTSEYRSPSVRTNLNHGKQLALAALNFESAHGSLPAAHSVDENGKRLLSWRVHLLPYFEQRELYDQFHLDEPWDSVHNRKLIEKMPDVFKHPTLKLPEGKTVYLAVTGEKAAIGQPKERGPRQAAGDTGMRNIIDGTSNTVIMVEVNSEHAVPWTQPKDFEGDGKALLEQTKGIRPGDEFLLIFCDGHVRTVSGLDTATLDNLLQIDDGNVVEIP